MQINGQNYLIIDTKVQDKFRQMLANLNVGNLKLKCVVLGDSDFAYDNTADAVNSRVLNAPFNVERIKYPLIYSGSGKGLNGYISCFARKVIIDPTTNLPIIQSMYDYPTTMDWSSNGQNATPPTVSNGYNHQLLTFSPIKMGYILYFQTILYNYYNPDNNLISRLNEKININITFSGSDSVPQGWEIIKDEDSRDVIINGITYNVYNNSVLITKDIGNSNDQNANGNIQLTGMLSNLQNNIIFNT